MLVLAVITCGAYIAYTIDSRTVAFFGTDASSTARRSSRSASCGSWSWRCGAQGRQPDRGDAARSVFLLILAGAVATILMIIYGR